ncbi:MAG: T9SS type A sorting domain-containing protein [candidate division KSB1 bacterium]|nr:T9SS type A sorting domain-containing protein [candidate division KSB1 bacterium]MDZ7318409.1 T9SS type A sorting domain-containing protein [candidate division KSB1 bacterium]MDZ7342004.1 T9SS type A sorting domain-containing protein [candidate division KSB1 bacterium]
MVLWAQNQFQPTASFLGTHEYERVGYHIHKAGDVNGDGYDDFLIGTFHNNASGYNSGAAYLILGKAAADWGQDVSLVHADARFIGSRAYEAAGYYLGGGGNLNGDAYDDFLIGAEDGYLFVILGKASANWGYNCILMQSADASYVEESDEDAAGIANAIIGDLNGDGYDDFLCGAPYNDYGAPDGGKVYLILGKSTGWARDISLSAANASFYGDTESGLVGYSVDGVGDVNGDGVPDFAIGARGEGKIYLFFGRRSVNWGRNCDIGQADVVIRAEYSGDYVGWRVSRAGDVNNDGYDDIVIGAPYNDSNGSESGKAYLVLGRSSGWKSNLADADASFIGEGANDQAGWDVQEADDVDKDGYDDFLVGAWYNDAHGVDAGKMYLIKGKASGWQRDVSLSTVPDYFLGEHAGDYAGFSVATAGDVNHDGWPDLITSATYYSEAYHWGGKIYLFVNQNASNPVITISVPNGGENWEVGSIHDILWTSDHTSGNVKIEYSTNNGSTWSVIIASTVDDGSYAWTIPNTPSANCLVKITDTNGSPADMSDAAFTISAATCNLIMAVSPANCGTTEPPVGNHSFTAGSMVPITAFPAAGYIFDHWTGGVADSLAANTTVTMNGNKTVTAFFVLKPISDAQASIQGENILLEWSASETLALYNVYRDTTYDFVPDVVNGTNRIGRYIYDQDSNKPGIQWTDIGNGADIVGDVTKNYFYKITVYNGTESAPSNVAGEFDYQLITTSGTDINEIVLVMDTRFSSNPITTAEQLAQAIPNCSDVYYWGADGQGTVGHVKGLPFNDFPVYPGYPYIVNVTAATVWSVAGACADTSFNLIITDGTDINHIGVPLSKSSLTTAEQLGQDIPGCTDVYCWGADGQGTIGHVVGLPFNDFAVRPGYPYYVNVTTATMWPEGSGSLAKAAITGMEHPRRPGRGAPHTVYGQIDFSDEVKVTAAQWHIRAWIMSRPGEVLTQAQPGVGCDGNYWWVGVSNFETPWAESETLYVELMAPELGLQGQTFTPLTTAGSDNAGIVRLSQAGRATMLPAGTIPQGFVLLYNYPNPFNPETCISYGLPKASRVILKIYNLLGREIRTLVNQHQTAGFHRVIWNGKDGADTEVPAGIYLLQIQADDFKINLKMIKVE